MAVSETNELEVFGSAYKQVSTASVFGGVDCGLSDVDFVLSALSMRSVFTDFVLTV